MRSPVVPKGVIAHRFPERTTLVTFCSSDMSFLPGYLQPQQLPEVSFFVLVYYTVVLAIETD